MKITSIKAQKILDSCGSWTIEATLEIKSGLTVTASVPGGVSTSPHCALTVPPDKAVALINGSLASKLNGASISSQLEFDNWLLSWDSTPRKSELGANTLLALSIVCAKALAVDVGEPLYRYLTQIFGGNSALRLPRLLVLVFEGGKHGGNRNGLAIQEYYIDVANIAEGLTIYRSAGKLLSQKGESLAVGLEGGYTPLWSDKEALRFLENTFADRHFGLDVAFESYEGPEIDYGDLVESQRLFLLEDPFSVDDWPQWSDFTKNYGSRLLVVADDLTATNPLRIKKVLETKAANAVIIKPNQIGTLSETFEAVKIAREGGLKTVVSHRGRETNDSFIADLAVAVSADYVKFGGFTRGERLAKYNRLLEISEEFDYPRE